MRTLFRVLTLTVAAMATACMKALSSLGRLFAGGGAYTPPPPIPTMTAADVRDEYEDGYERETAAGDVRASNIGQAIYQYASAEDPGIRCAVDLGGLNYQQMDWLLSLGDDDLKKLATAGPRACELAVTGRRSGIVGLPAPRVEDAAHEIVMHPVRQLLDDRIRRAGVRRDLSAA